MDIHKRRDVCYDGNKATGLLQGVSSPILMHENRRSWSVHSVILEQIETPKEEEMEFRPCIDIHNGKVKQIVGGTLKDAGNQAVENFVSKQDAAFYATLYQKGGIAGGHIILLNPAGSEYYEATKEQAMKALRVYPGGLQVGGGITDINAKESVSYTHLTLPTN